MVGCSSAGRSRAPTRATIPGGEPFEIADLMQQMSETIKKVNDTFDDMKAEIQGTVVAVGDTVDNVNALIVDVSDDLKHMTASGARIASDAARIAESVRSGKGTIGKLVNDDELYTRATAIAREAEDIATNARQ